MSAPAVRVSVVQAQSVRGIVLMIVAAGLLTINDAIAKYLVQTYPLGQVLALRHVVVVLVIVPYVAAVPGFAQLRVRNWGGQCLRGILFAAGAAFLVLGVKGLPLATVTSLTMTVPIFVAMLSVAVLGERVNFARWFATVGGFTGVLLIVRPGTSAFEWNLLFPLAAAFVTGLRDAITRRLARTETSISQLFWSNVIVTVACFFLYDATWRTLDTHALAWFLGAGVLSAVAHFVMIEAMRAGEAALVAPFRYTALVWAVLIGLVVWGHVPDAWVVLGAGVIAASGIGMLVMERRARRRG